MASQEIAMLHDVTKCSACRGCSVACKQWKNLPADPTPFNGEFQSHADLSPKTYTLIRMKENVGENNRVRWDFLKFQCMHCTIPGCAKGCPVKAYTKLDCGVVAHDKEKCVGCGYCEVNCTFGVPHVDKEEFIEIKDENPNSPDFGKVLDRKPNPNFKKATKCNLCVDRVEKYLADGNNPKYKPACAKTCTADAILFGLREDMVAIAEKRLAAIKKDYPEANLYNVHKDNGIQGAAMMYILPYKPSTYGLPDEPKLHQALVIREDFVKPIGKVLIGAAAVGVVGAAIANAGKKHE